jgi:alpha-amylase/alpha-mannosidase (GH57 family)
MTATAGPGPRCICIHGHFYQPPRENPWLEAVEAQPAAYPYHDWNERVAAECYAPNAASRILDLQGRISRIVNNYARISFDFGPSLLSWLEDHDPETYRAILGADRESIGRFGRGSALGCTWGHAILPLANERDRETQLVWGLRDFERRFGRRAEGFWLPETAVDLDVLDRLARHGIRFTVLGPQQAEAVRAAGGEWRDVSGERIAPGRSYLQRLPSGREIAIFFYDGPASRAVAFEGLLRDGARFAERLTGLLGADAEPQLANIATDGETFGHHQRFGDMALSFALDAVAGGGRAEITNYASFLAAHPATWEVRIRENTSWSCAHGIERWRSDCGCHTGGRSEWSQAWRAPLREAFDWLRGELADRFANRHDVFASDPWAARDDYIEVVLDRSPASVSTFLGRHLRNPGDPDGRVRALRLLEMQRHALLMYTSCGWFFHDVSGIETVQVLCYAGRAVQLADEIFGTRLEGPFLERLAAARSNVAEAGDARRIYEREVRPATLDLAAVGAHYAVSTFFDEDGSPDSIFCFDVKKIDERRSESDGARLAVGRVRVGSRITTESADLAWAVLHFGRFNLSGGIRPVDGDETWLALKRSLLDAFEEPDLPRLAGLLAELPERYVTLQSLFPGRRREVLERLMAAELREAEGAYRRLYETNVGLMHHLSEVRADLPRAFAIAAEYILSRDLIRTLGADPVDLRFVRSLLDQSRASGTGLDEEGVRFAFRGALERLLGRAARSAPDPSPLLLAAGLVRLARDFSLALDLWRAQNAHYALRERVLPGLAARAAAGDAGSAGWLAAFTAAADELSVAVT